MIESRINSEAGEESAEMGIWVTLQDRYIFILIFSLIILANIILLYALKKSRSEIPQTLTLLIHILCGLIIIVCLFAIAFVFSFGYNA